MSERHERILFIDALRGYAILMMLQGHTVGVVLKDELRQMEYPVFAVWRYFTGLTAPVFFLAAGLIFAYLLARAGEKGGVRVGRGLKRGGWLLVLGWITLMWSPIVRDLLAGDWSAWGRVLGRSHVLHTIGLSLWVLIGLWVVCRGRVVVFGWVGAGLGQFVLLGGQVWSEWEGWGRIAGTFFDREYAVFPLMPWAGYALTGASLGVWAWRGKWYRSWKKTLVVMGAGLVLMVLNWPIATGFWWVFGEVSWVAEFDLGGRYFRVGEAVFFTGVMAWFCDWLRRRGWADSRVVGVVTRCGQETLTIYFLHIFVVYSVVFGVGLSAYFSRAFGVWGTVGVALAVEAGFIWLVMNLSWLRERVPGLKLLR